MLSGANVESLERLAQTFREEADRIDQLRAEVTNAVFAAWWKGHDADSFRDEWESLHVVELRRIVNELSTNANLITQEAWRQREVSGG
jgi:uncharacterized protein YukE